jgi:methyl-accepting chemotaxis protein
MEEMTGTVSQNADNAQQANQLAIGAREQADAGGVVVSRAMAAMTEINNSSKKIADIIGVIDEIAFQTNLLALNAAVEAARAGEQGRGFAVVATEVRNLAGRSATAAKEIKSLIKDSVAKTQDGTKLVDESGHALTEIVKAVKKVSDIVAEIAAASREQSEGINQVNKALLQMDDMTQQNAALVEQASAAAEAIDAQSQELEHQVQFFKIMQVENKPRSLGQGIHSVSQNKARLESGGKEKLAIEQEGQENKKVLPKLQTEDDSDWKEF